MELTKISLATSVFNIEKGDFDLTGALNNWRKYVDEIVIATIPSEDNTLDILNSCDCSVPVKIVELDDSTDIIGWDGRIKNAAHQNSSHPIVAQIDLDERMGGNPLIWKELATKLLSESQIKSTMLPVINLWGSLSHYSDFGQKWYLSHKEGVQRGIVSFAKTENGFDRDRSDSCEAIDSFGNLVPSIGFRQFSGFQDELEYCKADLPFVWHLGYLDLSRRALINREFWSGVWDSYSGGDAGVPKTEGELELKDTFPHNLEIIF